MPSTATITAFYSFSAGNIIYSSQVNNNFSAFRGHLCPVDPTTGAGLATSGSWDLGASDHYWRALYCQYGIWYGNTSGSVPSSPSTNYLAVYAKGTEVYQKNPSGVEKQVGSYTLVNSRSSPLTITAAGGITYNIANGMRQMHFVTGDTTTGTDITANPQISAGTAGAELLLVIPNTTTSRPIILEHGNGLDQNGYFAMTAGCSIAYVHDGTEWLELHRKDT